MADSLARIREGVDPVMSLAARGQRGTWTPQSYLSFLRKRFARIYPVHAFMLLVFVAVTWLFAQTGNPVMSPGNTEWIDLVRALLLVHAWEAAQRYPWNGPHGPSAPNGRHTWLFPLSHG